MYGTLRHHSQDWSIWRYWRWKHCAAKDYNNPVAPLYAGLVSHSGIHAAGQELGIPWQTVQGFCKKAGVMEEASKKPAKKTKRAASSEPVASPAVAPTVFPTVEEKAEKKEEKTSKRGRKAADSTSAVTPDVEEKTTEPAEKKPAQPASALEIENAILRKENEQLKAKIQKLQKALAELI